MGQNIQIRRSYVWTWDTSIREADQKKAESVLARNRTWSSTFAESRAYPAHSKDILFVSTSPGSRTPSYGSEDRRASITLARHHFLVARPGIEPGPTASEAVMRSSTLTSQIVSTPTWNRTRTKTLGESCDVRYTIGTKSRRLDLHQHEPLYKSDAFLGRVTTAISHSITNFP